MVWWHCVEKPLRRTVVMQKDTVQKRRCAKMNAIVNCVNCYTLIVNTVQLIQYIHTVYTVHLYSTVYTVK